MSNPQITQPSTSGSGSSGGSGNTYAIPGAVSGFVSSALAFATQGNAITPLVNMTIDRVYASWVGGGASGHVYQASIVSLNTLTIVSQLGSATATGTGANQDLTFTFSPAVSLTAGTRYAILITDTNAASSTTSNSLGGISSSGGVYPIYGNLPLSTSANDQRVSLANNTGGILSGTLTASGGTAAVGMRAQLP